MYGFSQHTIQDFLVELAEKKPAPGGGAAAPICAAIASALAKMVVAYSIGKKSLEAHQPALETIGETLNTTCMRFQALAEEDAVAYTRLSELERLPDGHGHLDQIPEAKRVALNIPMQVVDLCVETLELCEQLSGISNKHLASDLGLAAVLLEGSARASRWMVVINAGGDPEPLNKVDGALERASALRGRIEKACAPA